MERSIVSYMDVAAAAMHEGLSSIVVPGILGKIDLPEVLSLVRPRRVTVISPAHATGRMMLRAEAEKGLGRTLLLLLSPTMGTMGQAGGGQRLTFRLEEKSGRFTGSYAAVDRDRTRTSSIRELVATKVDKSTCRMEVLGNCWNVTVEGDRM